MLEKTSLYVEIVEEREQSIRVFDGDLKVWLPKSQVGVNVGPGNGLVELKIPVWLAQEKGLI